MWDFVHLNFFFPCHRQISFSLCYGAIALVLCSGIEKIHIENDYYYTEIACYSREIYGVVGIGWIGASSCIC